MTGSVRETVVTTAAEVLGTSQETVRENDLSTLPAFNSFRAMEIVERVEQRLDIELDPDDLVPDNLFHLDALCATVSRAASATTGVS